MKSVGSYDKVFLAEFNSVIGATFSSSFSRGNMNPLGIPPPLVLRWPLEV